MGKTAIAGKVASPDMPDTQLERGMPSNADRSLPDSRNFPRLFAWLTALLMSGVAIETAQAHIIDRIEVNPAGNETEIEIVFDTRIQYLRETSLGNGEVHLYFNLLEPDPSATSPVTESKDSPPSDIAPHFTVSYPELDSALDIKFDSEVKYRVRPGKDSRSISIFVPAIRPPPQPSFVPPPTTQNSPEQVEREAKQLMDKVHDAIAHDQTDTSIETLNLLLNLPPNQQSQLAQRLIGEAREKNGEYAKARVEYELYLKLYPDAADAIKVKQQLARLPAETAKPAYVPGRLVGDQKWMVYGSVSQNYYKGVLHTETTSTASGIAPQPWTGTDQSLLISTLDITSRKRTETTDTRFVLRDDNSANFLPGQVSSNRLSAAYVEQSARDRSYLYRLGRQSGVTGGVLGRFDGAWLGYSLNPVWRVNTVFGSPVDYFNTGAEKKTFAGVSVDLTRLPDQWSGSAYFIEQHVKSVVDRKAVGMEAHYFDVRSNYTSLLDYDTLFKAVNIATFQGNWTLASGVNYNLLLDHRKSPVLQLSNALPGQAVNTISAALAQPGVTIQSLQQDAKALTPTTNLFMIGTNRPFSAKWRVGGDFRILNTSSTGTAGIKAASPGSGNIYIFTAQATGNSLLRKNDMGLVSTSYSKAEAYKSWSLGLNGVEPLRQNWRLDTSLQLSITDNAAPVTRQTKITPSLRLAYRLNESVSFEAEGGLENTRTTSTTASDKTQRKYFYLGYRWDFQ